MSNLTIVSFNVNRHHPANSSLAPENVTSFYGGCHEDAMNNSVTVSLKVCLHNQIKKTYKHPVCSVQFHVKDTDTTSVKINLHHQLNYVNRCQISNRSTLVRYGGCIGDENGTEAAVMTQRPPQAIQHPHLQDRSSPSDVDVFEQTSDITHVKCGDLNTQPEPCNRENVAVR